MRKLGLDFDNTLISYDLIFYDTASEYKLIPKDIKRSKNAVRNYLINKNEEKKFTELQGVVYGSKIVNAEQTPGMFEALKFIQNKGYELAIVSHKTKNPIIGPKYNLHKSALNWLEKNKFFDKEGLFINRKNVFFEPTKEEKVKRIKSIGCTHFIDDLTSILDFIDKDIVRIHYNPSEEDPNNNYLNFSKWENLKYIEIF